MTNERMIEIALDAGFTNAAVLSTEALSFRPEFRVFCEDNACGNYDRNYGCPPVCGTPQEMKERVLAYRHAIVFQTQTEMEDVFDSAAAKAIKKQHTARTLQVLKQYQKEGLPANGLSIMAGPCNYCDACKMVSGEPCCFPDMRFSCLSAYCIDANKLAADCGMEISWDTNLASFFSIYCF